MTYKIHMRGDTVIGFGPHGDGYCPDLVDGDRLEYSDQPPPPSSEYLFTALRTARDVRLTATDKYLLPDYPITADALAQVKAYRTTLRDLPDQTGAPWPDGDVPWPIKPNV